MYDPVRDGVPKTVDGVVYHEVEPPAGLAELVHCFWELRTDADLADGRNSLLGGESINYTDIAFASFTGLWLMPEGYGGGKADAVRIERERRPEGMRGDVERWIDAFPRALRYVEQLYEQRREQP